MFGIVAYKISADTKNITEKTEMRFEGSAMFPHSDKSPALYHAKDPSVLFGIVPAETKPVDTDQIEFERIPYRSLLLVQEVVCLLCFVPQFYKRKKYLWSDTYQDKLSI
jgi:hypothetical protein